MSPFAGEGVNLAMLDALELALAIAQTTDLNAAVRHGETAMIERAAEAFGMTIASRKRCFSPDGAGTLQTDLDDVRILA